MSQSTFHGEEPHWMEGGVATESQRGFLIVLLVTLILVGVGGLVWFSWRVPTKARLLVASLYVSDYDDRVLLDLPYAEQATRAIGQSIENRGTANVEFFEPVAIKGAETLRQEFDSLVRKLMPGEDRRGATESDVVLVYVRAYGIGTVSEDGKQVAELLAGDFRGSGTAGRVKVSELFNSLVALPAKAVVVVLDSGELEQDLSQNLLANTFPAALESTLADQPAWQKLWVINSNALLQPAHVSWRAKQTLLSSALAPGDWGTADRDQDRWVSLGDFYEWLLRYCDAHSNGRQTPLLMRGGHVPVAPDATDANWRDAMQLTMIETAKVLSAETPLPTATAHAPRWPRSLASPLRSLEVRSAAFTGVVPAQANRLSQATQMPYATQIAQATPGSTSVAAETETPAAPSAAGSPAAASGPAVAGPLTDRSGTAGAGAELSGGQAAIPTFAVSPRLATWAAKDRVVNRSAAGGWSPVDFAPGAWNSLLSELIALDRRHRMGEINVRAEEWQQYYQVLRHLAGDDLVVPQPSNQAAIDLIAANRSGLWILRKQSWASDSDLRPGDRAAWKEVQSTLRIYCDLTAEASWWLDLAVRLGPEGTGLLESSRRLCQSLRDAAQVMELDRIDPTGDGRSIVDLQLPLLRLRAELQSAAEQILSSTSNGRQPWVQGRVIDHLLRSPLITAIQRERLESNLAQLAVTETLFSRSEPLPRVWDRASQNRGMQGTIGWGQVDAIARAHESLLSLFLGDALTVAGITSIRDPSTLSVWETQYRGWEKQLRAEFARADSQDFLRWKMAAAIGPLAVRDSVLTTAEVGPAMVIAPSVDPSLRIEPKVPKPLTLLRHQVREPLDVLTLRIPGKGFPDRCRIAVKSPSESDPADHTIELWVEGYGRLDPQRVRSPGGELVPINSGGQLRLSAQATKSPTGSLAARSLPLEILAVDGDGEPQADVHPGSVTLVIAPPRPDHVDLWITTAGQPGEGERDAARLNQGFDAKRFEPSESFSGSRALVAIPSLASGVPYRLWAVNHAREGRTVRARVYPLDLPTGVLLRPGRITERRQVGKIPAYVSDAVRQKIKTGAIKPWMESLVQLGAAADGGESVEPTLPSDAVAFKQWWNGVDAASPPTPLPVGHGFLCLLQEVTLEPVAPGSEPTAKPRVTEKPGGSTWEKWIEVASHPLADIATRWDQPLLQIDPIRFDGNNGKLLFSIRGRPGVWAKYGLQQLPVEFAVTDSGAAGVAYRGVREHELTVKDPETSFELLMRPLPPERPTNHDIDVTIAGYPRRENFVLTSRGREAAVAQRNAEPKDADLLGLEAVTIDGEPLSVEFADRPGEPESLVLLQWQEKEGARIAVEYKEIRAAMRFDASRTSFQDFDQPDRIDRAELVMQSSLTGQEQIAVRHWPRDETFRLDFDPKEGIFRLATEVADHAMTFDLESEKLDEDRYELSARLILDGVIAAQSQSRRLIVDRTPPTTGQIRRRGAPANTNMADRDRLWMDDKFEVELETTDKMTQVSAVQFLVHDVSGDPTSIKIDARPIDSSREKWVALLDSADLVAAKLPRADYTIRAVAEDRAANRQEKYLTYRFTWQNQPKPENLKPGGPAAGGGVAALPANPPQNYAISISFTRNDGFPIRSEHMGTVKVKNLPGPFQRAGDKIKFTEVPEGEYEIEAAATWDKKPYGGKHLLAVPRDVAANQVITINLLPNKD